MRGADDGRTQLLGLLVALRPDRYGLPVRLRILRLVLRIPDDFAIVVDGDLVCFEVDGGPLVAAQRGRIPVVSSEQGLPPTVTTFRRR